MFSFLLLNEIEGKYDVRSSNLPFMLSHMCCRVNVLATAKYSIPGQIIDDQKVSNEPNTYTKTRLKKNLLEICLRLLKCVEIDSPGRHSVNNLVVSFFFCYY